MIRLQHIPPRVKRLLPFFLIFIAVVYMAERRKQEALPVPHMRLIAQEMRAPQQKQVTLSSLAGNTLQLTDFHGDVILLNFFATWCPPCREEMPSIEALFSAYRDKNFVVVGVATDQEGTNVVTRFVKNSGLTFPILLDAGGEASSQYQVRGIPATFLLDKQGRIAGTLTGGVDWNSPEAHTLVEQLLNE